MNWQQCRNVFPSYDEFNKYSKVSYRIHAIGNIPKDHSIILAKMGEICGPEWPLPLLQWMYLISDSRLKCISEYSNLIEQAGSGEIEIGTREEAFQKEDSE